MHLHAQAFLFAWRWYSFERLPRCFWSAKAHCWISTPSYVFEIHHHWFYAKCPHNLLSSGLQLRLRGLISRVLSWYQCCQTVIARSSYSTDPVASSWALCIDLWHTHVSSSRIRTSQVSLMQNSLAIAHKVNSNNPKETYYQSQCHRPLWIPTARS